MAPARQLVVSLDASVDIEVTDGTRMIFPPGTVMLAEDTWGKVSRTILYHRKGDRRNRAPRSPLRDAVDVSGVLGASFPCWPYDKRLYLRESFPVLRSSSGFARASIRARQHHRGSSQVAFTYSYNDTLLLAILQALHVHLVKLPFAPTPVRRKK